MNTVSKYLLPVVLLCGFISLNAEDELPSARSFIIRSAIVPGWGELALGDNSGYVFIATEVVFWAGHFLCIEEAGMREEAATEWAMQYGHIDRIDYDSQVFRNMGRYMSGGYEAGGYNENVRRTAAGLYPDDPDAQQSYIAANAIPEEQQWHWDDLGRKNTFNKLNKDVRTYGDYAETFTGLIIVNHIASVINTAIAHRNMKRLSLGAELNRDRVPVLSASWKF